MRFGDWFYKKQTLTANFVELSLDGSVNNLKFVASATCQISFDGKNEMGEIELAEGPLDFLGVNKGRVWVKGSGTVKVYGWE